MQSGRSSSALFPELHQRQSGGLHTADYRGNWRDLFQSFTR